MTRFLTITPRDPLVARDGRPFGEGQGRRMRSTGWLTPSVAAGSFRTAYAKACGKGDFKPETQEALLGIPFAGVFPMAEGELLLPAPFDCVWREREPLPALPQGMGEGGCDLPDGHLPVMLPEGEFKPEAGPAFWPSSQYAAWLVGGTVDPAHRLMAKAAEADLRDHVRIDAETGTAKDGHLFTTAGIAAGSLPRFLGGGRIETTLSARVRELPWGESLEMWHPLGGERRLVHWRMHADGAAWQCPPRVKEALGDTERIRLTFASPAIFEEGWRPPREIHGVELTLVGACIPRWRAVSGWSYKEQGPKAIRRVVPAGGTYFFKAEKGAGARLAEKWLEPVGEEGSDGFGLALWGTWEEG
ncbi:MAG: type III-B CRISPR module-associated protein Cmr3 [Gemmataceae bacterium]|nr:type III-B CRISPR module-associated protein Cmr3 [Gemmataceae bacterium]